MLKNQQAGRRTLLILGLAAFVSIKADIVSHAAATPLVREAGGRVTRLDGNDSADEDLEKIASNGLIHDELLACVRAAVSTAR